MYDSAFTAINKSLALEPYNITANQLYARIIFKLNYSFFDIQKDIDKIMKRTSDNIYVINDIAALIYNDTAINNSLAVSILKDAVKSSPPPIETDDESFKQNSSNTLPLWNKQIAKSYYHLGYIYGISENFNDAIFVSKKAIVIDSTLADAYINLISGYFSTNKIKEGKRILRIALKKFPHNNNLQQIQKILRQ